MGAFGNIVSGIKNTFGLPSVADGSGKPKVSSQFMKGGDSSFYFNWRPALRDARTDVAVSYSDAVARTIDAVHNSGWLAGCIAQSKGNIVGGTGLRLAHQPDASVLTDWTKKELDDWSRMVERRFEIFTRKRTRVSVLANLDPRIRPQLPGQLVRARVDPDHLRSTAL